MKIVHLLKHAQRGNGNVHMAVDLACAQADAGHDVWFASARGSYDELLRQHGVTVSSLPEPTGAKGAARNGIALLSLARAVKPDVLHAHMMSSAVLAWPVAKIVGAPLITTMHNSFDSHSWMMRAGKTVVAVSEAERALLLSRGYPEKQVVTVLNGTAGTARGELPLDDLGTLQRPCIMTLSGLHPRKAVDDVISAFSIVAADHPDWHLNIVGWGDARASLEAQAAEAGLEDSVHFLGSTLTPWPLLDQADIVATASLADPCPLSVMEARVAGCAVVGTAAGGIPEVLEFGEAGHIVPVRDPEAMAEAFRGLMADPENLHRWRGRAKAGSEYFSVRRMAEDYDRVYRDAMSARGRLRVVDRAMAVVT